MAWNNENIGPSVTGEVDAALVSLGQRGCVYVNDDSDVVGNFAAIQIVTDTVFNSISTVFSGVENPDTNLSEALECCSNTTPATFPAGFILYGPFVRFALFSGSVIAYKA